MPDSLHGLRFHYTKIFLILKNQLLIMVNLFQSHQSNLHQNFLGLPKDFSASFGNYDTDYLTWPFQLKKKFQVL